MFSGGESGGDSQADEERTLLLVQEKLCDDVMPSMGVLLGDGCVLVRDIDVMVRWGFRRCLGVDDFTGGGRLGTGEIDENGDDDLGGSGGSGFGAGVGGEAVVS